MSALDGEPLLSSQLTTAPPMEIQGSADASCRRLQVDHPDTRLRFLNNKISNTKYSPLTFLPKNLAEQFSRHINRYFLLIACLQLWSAITPVNPVTTWFPLIVIFLITACKEGYDDLLRWRSDCKANAVQILVHRGGEGQHLESEQICVGDLVQLSPGEQVPCDLVLLSGAAGSGECLVSTANLDGESDLKSKSCPGPVLHQFSSQESLLRAQPAFVIECEAPNPVLHQFDSKMWLDPARSSDPAAAIPLSLDNLLLQGCVLKGADSVVGAAVYTGPESKLSMNCKLPPLKLTSLDKFINLGSVAIFCAQLLIVLVFGVTGAVWETKTGKHLWYLQLDQDPVASQWWSWIVIPLRFLLLCSFMIPISLKVTLDLCKMSYAYFVHHDLQLYDSSRDLRAIVNNSSIGEELGQVSHVLTDKTGTLTQNEMRFEQCLVPHARQAGSECWEGVLYTASPEHTQQLQQAVLADHTSPSAVLARCLAVCHELALDDAGGYQGASPDEVVLTQWAAECAGVAFSAREGTTLVLQLAGREERYELLAVLQFDSVRKSMSVLVRSLQHGGCELYTKGADEAVLQLLHQGKHHSQQEHGIAQAAEELAGQGLRTLMMAWRSVPEAEAQEWLGAHQLASTTTGASRSLALRQVYALMEKELHFAGLSGIADSLQEGVPETIQTLRGAGMAIWVLTGDKLSTGAHIAAQCQVVPMEPTPEQLVLWVEAGELSVSIRHSGKGVGSSTPEQLVQQCQAAIQEHIAAALGEAQVFLLLDGISLQQLLPCPEWTQVALSPFVQCVVCCRVTPKQKADVVAMVKQAGRVTLAVGDGGNDVPMIQEAHVGVGLQGKEGLQAAAASDYSLGQFRFLARLILVHGHWAYHRTSVIAQYSFYRSIFLAIFQVAYAVHSGFSGTSWFNTFALTGYNAVFTALPPLLYMFDRDSPQEQLLQSCEDEHPHQLAIKNKLMNWGTLGLWLLRATIQAVAIALMFQLGDAALGNSQAQMPGSETVSMSAYSGIILIQTATMLLESNSITVINHAAITGSLLLFVGSAFALSAVPRMSLYGIMPWLAHCAASWLYVFLVVTVTSGTLLLPQAHWLACTVAAPLAAPGHLPLKANGYSTPCGLEQQHSLLPATFNPDEDIDHLTSAGSLTSTDSTQWATPKLGAEEEPNMVVTRLHSDI